MRILFVGHAYHRLTKSCNFFLKILSTLGEVSCIYENDGEGVDHRHFEFKELDYDLIVVWQIHQVLNVLSGRHPNVVFVPMYDAMRVGRRIFWNRNFGKAKILCFSKNLHEEMTRRGAASRYFQFFPNPADWAAVEDYENIRAFFWYRKEPIDVKSVFALCGQNPIEAFRLHNTPDPGAERLSVTVAPPNVRALEISTWFEDFNSYKNAIRQCNVFFASRLFEGIGMGFLEAMASGLCVVAPNNPTMNEYIEDDRTGMLYAPASLEPLNFDRIRDIGLRAREAVEGGFKRWELALPGLVDFVAMPTSQIEKKGRAAGWMGRWF